MTQELKGQSSRIAGRRRERGESAVVAIGDTNVRGPYFLVAPKGIPGASSFVTGLTLHADGGGAAAQRSAGENEMSPPTWWWEGSSRE